MENAKLYLEKDEFLSGTFSCLSFNGMTYRFRISDSVVQFLDLKKDMGNDYLLTLKYKNGTIDEEYLELDYMFRKVGLPTKILNQINEVILA